MKRASLARKQLRIVFPIFGSKVEPKNWNSSQQKARNNQVSITNLDEDLAERLVKVLEATWDPPITPQAEAVRFRKAEQRKLFGHL